MSASFNMAAALFVSIAPDVSWLKDLAGLDGGQPSSCYQCLKCTNGCPVASAMDIPPHRIVHLLNLGMADRLLHSDAIWVCTSCQTCSARCPNKVDLAHTVDILRQTARRKGIKTSQRAIPVFHQAFLGSVKRHGRVQETELAVSYSTKNGGLAGLARMAGFGLAMFRRGKISFRFHRVHALRQVKDMFREEDKLQW